MKVESVGNPDFWQTAHAVNPAAFIACHALGSLFEILHSKEIRGKLPVAIGRMMDVCFKSLGAVVNLTLNGFDTDAMRIARSMWEYDITAQYLLKNPSVVDDYNDFLYATMQDELEFLLEHEPALLTDLPQNLLDAARDQLNAADRFRSRTGKIKNSWKDVTIKQMAEDVGRGVEYRTFYRWGSGFVHGDITSIVGSFDMETGHVDIGPSTKWTHTALLSAHSATVSLMTTLNRAAELGFEADIDQAIRTFHEAWEPLQER